MNELLQRTEQAILEKSDPRLQPVITKVVDAGEQILYSEQTRDLVLQQLSQEGDPLEIIGAGTAKIMAILQNKAKGTIPPEAFVPAANVLMCRVLDFAEQIGAVQVDNETVAQATQETNSAVLQVLGVSPQQLEGMMKGQGASALQGGPSPQPAGSMPAPGAPPQGPAAPVGIIGQALGGV